MSHYAKVVNGKVTEVLVAEESFISGLEGTWIQTSYNTLGGVHLLGGTPLRKNFAGVGYDYNEELDAFIPPKPFPSWTLNTSSCLWEPPTPRPEGYYGWNEETLSWIEVHIYGA